MPFVRIFASDKTVRHWTAILAGALAFAAMAAADAAHADWRFTKWGMSAAEAQAANAALVDKGGAHDGRTFLTLPGPHEINGVNFKTISLMFVNDKLSRVALRDASPTQMRDLLQALSTTFGSPMSSNLALKTFIFRDTAKGNTVELYCGYSECMVAYTPLAEGF
jgi:hypothetical protein